MIYGYCRVSTKYQSLKRQEDNIKKVYPSAIIYKEKYTGTTLDRPEFSKMIQVVKPGDTIVFDAVSRMSRTAEEGFALYKEMLGKSVSLVFIKEPSMNTSNFLATTKQVQLTGTDVDVILEAVNKYLFILTENQIKAAFETAEHEVTMIHKNTSDGMKAHGAGKKISEAKTGTTYKIKRADTLVSFIRKYSKDFDGSLSDTDVMDLYRQQQGKTIARNTYYRYKRMVQNGD